MEEEFFKIGAVFYPLRDSTYYLVGYFSRALLKLQLFLISNKDDKDPK